MPIYRFGVDTGSAGAELFLAATTDFRSDAEQRHTQLALHDPDSNDLKLARKMADEIINVSGAEVKVYARTDNPDYDHVHDADPDPTYWAAVPMKAYFKPQPLELELKKWGAEAENKTEIVFSHRQLYTQYGNRMLRPGDVVKVPYNAATPHLNPNSFRITNATPSGNFRYNWLYFTCQVTLLTADITVRTADDTPTAIDTPDMGGYRESW